MSFMKRYAFHAVFKPENGEGSGGSTGNEPGQKTEAELAAEKATKEAADKKAADDAAKAAEKRFTQADLDKAITDRLDREKTKTEREAKEKQGEFEKLYNETKPKLEQNERDLAAITAERDELSAIVTKTIEGTIKDWPAEIKELHDKELSPAKQLVWVEKMRPVVEKMQGNSGGTQKPPKVNGENGAKGGSSGAKVGQDYLASRYGLPPKKS
jgi:hypothetical protein